MPLGAGATGDRALAAQPATKTLATVLAVARAAGTSRAMEVASIVDSATVH